MKSWRERSRGLVAAAAVGVATAAAPAARAAGGMDPTYQELLAEPTRAVGRTVDWTVRLTHVNKRFYTYTMAGRYIPGAGDAPCNRCMLFVIFRGRPEETARPPRFRAGMVVGVRGIVLRLQPLPAIMAGAVVL